MCGIRLFQAAFGGLILLGTALAVSADAPLDVAKAKYAASDDRFRQEAAQEEERLLERYGGSVAAQAQVFKSQGKLGEFLAASQESDRAALERNVPEQPAPDLPADIARLQQAARSHWDRIRQKELQQRTDLAQRYLAFLDRQVRQLTIEGQIAEAQEANEERQRIESVCAALVATRPPTEPPSSPATVSPATSAPAVLAADPRRRGVLRPPEMGMELCLTFEKGLADRIKTPKITWQNVEEIEDGRFGQGCRFAGNGKITIDSVRVPDKGSWCIWARISPTADLTGQTSIIDANGMGFYVLAGELHCAFYDGTSPLVGKTAPVQGKWMHLAVTWGNGERRFYADGNLVATVSYSGKPWAAKRTMQLGTRWTGAERYFMGDIDELILYDRCLTPEEIAIVAAQAHGGK